MMNEFEAKDYIWNKGCECKSIEDITSTNLPKYGIIQVLGGERYGY